ncbi:MAG: hypothetical protein FJW95_09180 [Actinobacteria bacterium]|nr:hypothetical protein [Actinomycetota bacterium]
MTIRLVSPEGRVHEPRAPLAPAVPDLAGLRLAVLDNGKPHAGRLMTEIARRIAARTDAELALVVAKGTAATPAEPEILQQLEVADLVLTGSAD